MGQRTGKNSPRPRIGVTGNSKRFSPSWLCLRLSIWLTGGKAVRIYVGHLGDLASLSGMIISGGDDIYPALYGEEPLEGGHYDRQRDSMEIECVRYALHRHLPLLGICRGHQLINTVLGGGLHSSVREMRVHTSNRWSLLPKKRVSISSVGTLAKILKKKSLKVNSLHSQAIAGVADTLREVAHDRDNLIQAVEAADGGPLLGVQWHPEYLCYLPSQLRLFHWLVNQAAKKGGQPVG